MKNLDLCIAITLSISAGCIDTEQPDAELVDGTGGKADALELAYFTVTNRCTNPEPPIEPTCSLIAQKLNSADTITIQAIAWPDDFSDDDKLRVEDELYGARVLFRGALSHVSGSTDQVLDVSETWIAATGGFVPGAPAFVSLQPIRAFCPAGPCAKQFAQGLLNGPRLDDVEVDLTRLYVADEVRAAIAAQLDDVGILALGSEIVDDDGATRFTVERAYLPVK